MEKPFKLLLEAWDLRKPLDVPEFLRSPPVISAGIHVIGMPGSSE